MTKIKAGNYKDVLKPHQISILQDFFSEPESAGYFLTGGTALAGFYLYHRLSKDLDFFNIGSFDTFFIERFVQKMGEKYGCEVTNKVKASTYAEYYLKNKSDGWIQRLDFVKEQPVRLGDVCKLDGIIYDSLDNIATNKICAIYGRLEPKDYVDLYLIVNELGLDFYEYFDLAKQKDSGLHEFYFANILETVSLKDIRNLLLYNIDEGAMNDFYHNIKVTLLSKIKPQ
ncbi:hypothetical protein COT50_02695 [candidate division WWE3 bacterium CG08_land_8_20_14_0_20_41_10]|uniref:Nucleotidyl transferase AbiEii/AbiGii toxin family protein n=1 Tax=candidate division WWE3 bacterium CG08_land_8_20_14_0_20_41_10 TaxID=1975085 RepID=A0A2H0XBW6_UNCKA|nr:MAG: hypothetical protein COT50_02695 [candidate division WWE3 bacterium CG08_land_8_20_14_0_20_41_10]